jgi:hypothetical protein
VQPARRLTAVLAGVATGLLALLGAIALTSSPAAAAPYPPTVCAAIAVSTTTPHANQEITVSGTGFTAGDQVDIALTGKNVNKTIGHASIAGDGTFSTQVRIPAGIEGNFDIDARGGGPTCPVDPILLDVRAGLGVGGVAAGPGGSGGTGTNGSGGLAFTGLNALLLIAAAAALIGTGVLLARGGRRRTHSGW